jgi:hypothetical protein
MGSLKDVDFEISILPPMKLAAWGAGGQRGLIEKLQKNSFIHFVGNGSRCTSRMGSDQLVSAFLSQGERPGVRIRRRHLHQPVRPAAPQLRIR